MCSPQWHFHNRIISLASDPLIITANHLLVERGHFKKGCLVSSSCHIIALQGFFYSSKEVFIFSPVSALFKETFRCCFHSLI